MKIRKTTGGGDDKIELQMTPMIDIVFQLLIFFIMTFKIVVQEGDFNIKMPAAAPSSGNPEDLLPPIRVRLTANADGSINGIRIGETPVSSWTELHNEIIGIVGTDQGPGALREEAEVELDCDHNLHYEYVIAAISAVSGKVSGNKIIKLVEKIKFAPPREPAG